MGEPNAVNVRLISILAGGMSLVATSASAECIMNEIAKANTRLGICRQQIGIATGYGCTTLLMRAQVADQFKQIELARRCGFKAEADKLERFYKQTTPLVVSLYECVDTSVDRADVEKQANQEVEKSLSSLAPGCPADLKKKMGEKLPKLIAIDEKSLAEMQVLAEHFRLTPDQAK
jgi:hypothetical protein